MPTYIGTGFSQHPDPATAFREATVELKNKLNAPSLDTAIVFFTSGYAHQSALEPLTKLLQPGRVVGSLAPVLIVDGQVHKKGVAILGITSDEIRPGSSVLEQLSLLNMREAGLKAARMADTDAGHIQRQGMIFFMNGVSKNNSHFLRGLQEALGRAFPFAGVIGSNEPSSSHSCQLYKQALHSDAFVGLLIGGTATLATACRHGWKPLGKPRIIDAATGNIIKVIDKKPAVSLYEDYFRDKISGDDLRNLVDIALLYPMGISTERPKEYLLRHPVQILSDGSIVCQADIPTGTRIHLMIGDKDECRQAAREAATEVRDRLMGRHPKVVFVFASYARYRLFGRKAPEEINIIKEILGFTVPLFGMYTYGEIGAFGAPNEARDSQVHNGSITVTAIG